MEKLGKILILFQVTFALFCLVGAAAVLTQHLNWFEVKSTTGQRVVGVLDPLQAEAKALSQAHERTASRWRTQAVELAELEKQLPARRDYYAGLIDFAQAGKSSAAPEAQAPAFRDLPYEEGGSALKLIDLAAAPKASNYRDNKPLSSLADYGRQLADVGESTEAALKGSEAALLEYKRLNEVIVGTPTARGLRQLITDQLTIKDALVDELKYVAGPTFNRVVERGLFTQRLESVRERVAELNR